VAVHDLDGRRSEIPPSWSADLPTLTSTESRDLEREYVAHRAAVLAMLRSDYRSLPDHEELYQEAWAAVLELRARGVEIDNLRALLKKIAWRRARDRVRKHTPDALDPDSYLFAIQADDGPTTDEQALINMDVAIARQIVDSLEPRHAAVLKLRFEEHLDSNEIRRRLDVSPKRLEKIVTEAYKRVHAQLEKAATGETEWTRRQRSLLLVCEMGLATAEQRARAQQMVLEDPRCAAMLREMRSTLDRVAALLPVPVVAEQQERIPVGLVDRFSELLAWSRDQVASLVSRFGGQASQVEQVGVGGAAGLSGATAAKFAIACIAAAGGATVCVESGLFGGQGEKPPVAQASEPRSTPRARMVSEKTPATTRAPAKRRTASRASRPKRTTFDRAPASPARQGASEFEFEQTAPAAPPQPAPAPVNGGGEFTP
jgi:RNA polymerase sigma factor (sigma-70 family)